MSVFAHLLADLEGFTYPCRLQQNTTPGAVEMDIHITNVKLSAESTMGKILVKEKKATPQDKPQLQALALLYSLVIFQLYNGESDAISVLDELKSCYDTLVRHKHTKGSDTDSSEVLVQLLLSFLSKPSVLLRKVSQHVFTAFVGDITSGGLELMTEVLESGESLRGQQTLFDQEPEDEDLMDQEEDEEEANGDDDELDSDVEVVDMRGLPPRMGNLKPYLDDSEDDDDAESEDEDEDEEEEESGDEDDEEDKRLKEALAKALGTDADLSDSDADMTDSEMMPMDTKLAEIFSQRKKIPNKKQEQKEAKEMMINFKSRILDLLDIYAKKQASNPLAFDMLIPLLQLMRTTKTTQLRDRAREVIATFAKFSKKHPVNVNVSSQIELMKAIHVEASKNESKKFTNAASSASLIVASSLYRTDKSNLEEIDIVYKDTLAAWGEKVVKSKASFLQDYINFCQNYAKS
jgi:DNA polymerase phi